ncbi:MAG TPA: hypothetical protein DCQ06_14260 [Myxococcales bacterium]|nr:hypothetical protein [Myxococcales bacterium]HAN32753.1 hypothetical protein [Myxococcales bacterium]
MVSHNNVCDWTSISRSDQNFIAMPLDGGVACPTFRQPQKEFCRRAKAAEFVLKSGVRDHAGRRLGNER